MTAEAPYFVLAWYRVRAQAQVRDDPDAFIGS